MIFDDKKGIILLIFHKNLCCGVLIRIAGKAILMSTHNIGFYEDLTKIIFQLSSNIIKYALYLFFWASFVQRCFRDAYLSDRILL